jgi:tRNA 2-thiouridine synthesizing protein A
VLVVERWDAGDTGCGQLVFELHKRLDRMQPGETLEVVARDPGAPKDLPAWCRMTGHALLSADHPVYRIQRKPS